MLARTRLITLRFTWKGLKSRALIGPVCLSDCPTTESAPELIMTSGLYTVKIPFSPPPISRPPVPSAPSPKLTHTMLCNLWGFRWFSLSVHYLEIWLYSYPFLIFIPSWQILRESIMDNIVSNVLLQIHKGMLEKEKVHCCNNKKRWYKFYKSPVSCRECPPKLHFQGRIRKIHLEDLQCRCGVERGVELLCWCS